MGPAQEQAGASLRLLFPLKHWFSSSVVGLKDLKQRWVGSVEGEPGESRREHALLSQGWQDSPEAPAEVQIKNCPGGNGTTV